MAYAYRSSSEETEDDSGSEKSFGWAEYLLHNPVKCVPVDSFSTAPLSKQWNYVAFKDMIVEVELNNTDQNDDSDEDDDDQDNDSYWLGSTAEFCGYMTKINYLGIPDDPKNMDLIPATWKNFASEVFRVGHSAFNKYNLIPPFDISLYYPIGDFREYIVKTITGRLTLHPNMELMKKNNNSNRFAIGSSVEVLDKSNMSQMKLGMVDKVVGHRLHVKYWDCDDTDEGLWCNDSSQSVQMCGWSNAVGHLISAPIAYNPPEMKPLDVNNGVAIPDIKIHVGMKLEENIEHNFKVGYKLEAVDAGNPNLICVATVSKVIGRLLRIHFDGWEDTYDQWADIESPDLFPVGWCQMKGCKLESPPQKSAARNVQSTEKTSAKVPSRKQSNVYSEPEDDVPMSTSPPSMPLSGAITKTSTSLSEPMPSTDILIASKDPEQQIVGAVYALGRKNKPKPKLSQDMIRQLLRVRDKTSNSFMSSSSKNNVTKE